MNAREEMRGTAPPAGVDTPFFVLGAAGLLPFVGLAGWILVSDPPARIAATNWLLTYAAVILSFVGALHWGVAMVAPARDAAETWIAAGWSVLPALVGWTALAWTPQSALVAIAAMFVAQLAMDRRLARRYPLPAWFLRLRASLTIVVVASLAAAAAVA